MVKPQWVRGERFLLPIYSSHSVYIYPSLFAPTYHSGDMYGDKDFSDDINKTILELTIKFINETGRFD